MCLHLIGSKVSPTRGTEITVLTLANAADGAPQRIASAPTVVIAPTHGWGSTVQVSSHHLARAFARYGWRVLFLSTPVSPWHALSRRSDIAIREKLAAYRKGVFEDRGVLSYVPMTWFPHTYKRPFDSMFSLRNWHRFTFPDIRRTLRRSGCDEPDLLIVDNVVMGWLLDELRPRKSVYRITDHYASFAKTTAAMKTVEAELAARVDLVAYTAGSLKSYAENFHPIDLICMQHAVDADFFDDADVTMPEEYHSIRPPRAVFVGVIGEWFDVGAVNRMAERLPDVSFVLIGPDQGPGRHFRNLSNLHILGPRSREHVPAYLKHAQIGLIPFDRVGRQDLVDGINPLKLYEYLACGLPVVATFWPELERLDAPILTCSDNGEFAACIELILCGDGPDVAAGQAFARRADWQERIGQLLGRLGLE